MTAEEAITGIQEISRHFGQGYKWGELEPIWKDLLQCASQAMVRFVGITKKHGNVRPSPDYLLQRVQWWNMNLEPQIRHDVVVDDGRDPDAQGREALALMQARLRGDISDKEYAARLYSMSERYGSAGYAEAARDAQGYR